MRLLFTQSVNHLDQKSDWSNDMFPEPNGCSFVCPLSRLTEDCSRVTVVGCLEPDPSKIIVQDILKLSFMVQDVRMCEDYCISDIYIMDYNRFTVGHVSKVTLPILKKMELCAMVGYIFTTFQLSNLPEFCDVTPCILEDNHLCSGGTRYLHL
jgi:hypothetical protein